MNSSGGFVLLISIAEHSVIATADTSHSVDINKCCAYLPLSRRHYGETEL